MYVFRSDTFCDDCGSAIAERLKLEGSAPADPSDERSYDSDDFPKSAPDGGECDYVDHCARDRYCSNRVDLRAYGLGIEDELVGAEGWYIGAILNDSLTDEGVSSTLEMLQRGDETPYQSALHRLWRETFPQLDTAELKQWEDRAREMGADHGRAAASWFFDGNTSDETYRRVLKGLEEGDPRILDMMPPAPLSGEWADGPTPSSVLEDLGVPDDDETRADVESDICDAYEEGFYYAAEDEITSTARQMLERPIVAPMVKPDLDDYSGFQR